MALAASSLLLAFIYMWGSLFKNPQLMSYVKQELLEILVTGILIILLFAGIAAMAGMKVADFVPNQLLPSDVDSSVRVYDAAAKFYQHVDDDISGWLGMNYVLNMYVDQVASVTPYARPLGVGMVASPMAGFASPIKQLLYNMVVAVALAFIMNHAQLVVYMFAVDAFMKFYIPMGIFFRSFTPTRRLGGTMIGVGVAFLFVFPALSVISYSMFYRLQRRAAADIQQHADHSIWGSTPPRQLPGPVQQSFFSSNFSDIGTR